MAFLCKNLNTFLEGDLIMKPINPKYEGYVHGAGLALLLLLMVVVTFNDIVNLIKA